MSSYQQCKSSSLKYPLFYRATDQNDQTSRSEQDSRNTVAPSTKANHEYKNSKVSLPKHYYRNAFLSRDKKEVKHSNLEYNKLQSSQSSEVSLPKHYYRNTFLGRDKIETKNSNQDSNKLQSKKSKTESLDFVNNKEKKVSHIDDRL